MKKFLSIFAFAAVLVFTAFAPHAFAEVNIGIDEAYFDQAKKKNRSEYDR